MSSLPSSLPIGTAADYFGATPLQPGWNIFTAEPGGFNTSRLATPEATYVLDPSTGQWRPVRAGEVIPAGAQIAVYKLAPQTTSTQPQPQLQPQPQPQPQPSPPRNTTVSNPGSSAPTITSGTRTSTHFADIPLQPGLNFVQYNEGPFDTSRLENPDAVMYWDAQAGQWRPVARGMVLPAGTIFAVQVGQPATPPPPQPQPQPQPEPEPQPPSNWVSPPPAVETPTVDERPPFNFWEYLTSFFSQMPYMDPLASMPPWMMPWLYWSPHGGMMPGFGMLPSGLLGFGAPSFLDMLLGGLPWWMPAISQSVQPAGSVQGQVGGDIPVMSYPDEVYKNLPVFQFLSGQLTPQQFMAMRSGTSTIPGLGNLTIPSSRMLSYPAALRIAANPITMAISQALWNAANRDFGAEAEMARLYAPLGQAIYPTLVRYS